MNEQILYIAFMIAGILGTAAGIRLWRQRPKTSAMPPPPPPTEEMNHTIAPSIQIFENQVNWLRSKDKK